jgi:hypothetical protein
MPRLWLAAIEHMSHKLLSSVRPRPRRQFYTHEATNHGGLVNPGSLATGPFTQSTQIYYLSSNHPPHYLVPASDKKHDLHLWLAEMHSVLVHSRISNPAQSRNGYHALEVRIIECYKVFPRHISL